MATCALIHGAGDVGWYWHLVAAELRGAGHDVAPTCPATVWWIEVGEYLSSVPLGPRRGDTAGPRPADGDDAPRGQEARAFVNIGA